MTYYFTASLFLLPLIHHSQPLLFFCLRFSPIHLSELIQRCLWGILKHLHILLYQQQQRRLHRTILHSFILHSFILHRTILHRTILHSIYIYIYIYILIIFNLRTTSYLFNIVTIYSNTIEKQKGSVRTFYRFQLFI